MRTESLPTIGIIGAGRLGTSLAAAAGAAGYEVAAVSNSRAQQSLRQVTEAAQLVFLAVPDGSIAEIAGSLPWRAGQYAVHCSGALGRETLLAAEAAGAITGTFHPLQTFPSRTPEPRRFRGIAIGIEAPVPLGPVLETVATDLGARPFRMEGVDRALYHASAVVASNLLVALASAATRLWAMAGLPEDTGRTSLAPLITAAATNIASMELGDALTGPIARGDIETVARHLAALESAPELRELYRRLSLELLRLPLSLPSPRTDALQNLLKSPHKETAE